MNDKKFPMTEKDFKHFIACAECKTSGAVLDGVADRFHCRYNTYYRQSSSKNRLDYDLGWFTVHNLFMQSDIDIHFYCLPM